MPWAGESSSEPHHGLPKTLAGLLFLRVAPQETRERVACMRTAGPEREVGKRRLRLAHGQGTGAPVRTQDEPTQQPKTESRHLRIG